MAACVIFLGAGCDDFQASPVDKSEPTDKVLKQIKKKGPDEPLFKSPIGGTGKNFLIYYRLQISRNSCVAMAVISTHVKIIAP